MGLPASSAFNLPVDSGSAFLSGLNRITGFYGAVGLQRAPFYVLKYS